MTAVEFPLLWYMAGGLLMIKLRTHSTYNVNNSLHLGHPAYYTQGPWFFGDGMKDYYGVGVRYIGDGSEAGY